MKPAIPLLLLTLTTLWGSPGHVSCVRASIPKWHASILRWRQWSLRGGGEKQRTRRGCKRFAWELDAEVACAPRTLYRIRCAACVVADHMVHVLRIM